MSKSIDKRQADLADKLQEESDAVLVLCTYQEEDNETGVSRTVFRIHQRGNDLAVEGMVLRYDMLVAEAREALDADVDGFEEAE